MRKKRHNYTPEEKISILRRHLIDRVPVSDLCDEYQLQPKLFYDWQKLFFENEAAAFTRSQNSQKSVEANRIQDSKRNSNAPKTNCNASTKFSQSLSRST
jgi:transposase-like protein